MGSAVWLDNSYWAHPAAGMPWGTHWMDPPGCCDEKQCTNLVTHPDLALWRWAYTDLNRNWNLGTPLPSDYLDDSLDHLCGGLTWPQLARLLRTDPPDPWGLPRTPWSLAAHVPVGPALQLFCGGGWYRTLDRQWGGVLRYLTPSEGFRWARACTTSIQTLRKYPAYTEQDMALTTQRLLGDMFFALLSGHGACRCHGKPHPPRGVGPP